MTDTRTANARTDPYDMVCHDPAAYFETPQAVVDDETLTHAEKLQLLDEWAHDLADRSSAADEGMVPEIPGTIDRDVKLGAEIIAARQAVEASEDASAASLPVRLWRRLTGTAA